MNTKPILSKYHLAILALAATIDECCFGIFAFDTDLWVSFFALSASSHNTWFLAEIENLSPDEAVVVGIPGDPHVAMLTPIFSPLILHKPIILPVPYQ